MFPSTHGRSTSHRGVDLGPHRLHMPGGLLRRVRGEAGQDVASSNPGESRYGSGARFGSRDRERDRGPRRAVSFDSASALAEPAGPATRQGWIDALNSFSNRVEALERTQRNHAQSISKLDRQMVNCEQHVKTLYEKIEATTVKADQAHAHLNGACANVNAKFATSEATEAAIGQLLARLDETKSELQVLSHRFESERGDSWNRYGARPFEGPQHVPIGTPGGDDEERRRESELARDGAYPLGPGGKPMWNAMLPPAANPGQNMNGQPGFGGPAQAAKATSPLRNANEPYHPPPPAEAARSPLEAHEDVQDHAGCLQASPLTRAQAQGGQGLNMPASWSRPLGAATPPWQSAQHQQRIHPQCQSYHHQPQYGAGPYAHRPDFHGGNKVQFMGNRKAMDKKSEALKRFSGNPGEFTTWSNRFIDHMGRVHPEWRNTLTWLSET